MRAIIASQNVSNDVLTVLMKLRIVLSIPPIPPSYKDALVHRASMINDLKNFEHLIVNTKFNLSLKVRR
jgi:hypothetical protein